MNFTIISKNNALLYFDTQNKDHSIQSQFINHSNFLPKIQANHQIILILN